MALTQTGFLEFVLKLAVHALTKLNRPRKKDQKNAKTWAQAVQHFSTCAVTRVLIKP